MKRTLLASAIAVIVSISQMTGQSTTTTTSGQTGTYTQTETQTSGGRTITTTTSTYTHTLDANASFGLKVNANMSNFTLRDMNGFQSNMKSGISAGGFMKIESGNFALQYELMLHYRVSEMENKIAHTVADYKYLGLEIPIYFMGQINVGAGKIFIGAGPFVSVGLDAVQEPGNIDLYRKSNITDKSIMQRWDFGLSGIAGYEFDFGLMINGGYQAGFINAASSDDYTMFNRSLYLGVGFKF